MGFLSDLFKKGEEPEQVCSDPVLGRMIWSEDDEAWFGEHEKKKYSLAYERTRTPPDALVAYAREVLHDTDWLASSLAAAKERARAEGYDNHEAELASLTFGTIHFYLYKGKRRIIADLEGGKDDRCWRIEFDDRTCEGIGFDR